jgi:hypothetical protein
MVARRDQRTIRLRSGTATLLTFWALCDRCELIYTSGDAEAAVEVMRSSDGWSWVTAQDVAECIRKPLEVFRRADKGARRLAE